MSARPYTSPLRERQTAETRAAILEALGAELVTVGAGSDTAERASGVGAGRPFAAW